MSTPRCIDSFRDEYSFLSNFYVCFASPGTTVEHRFQAAKAANPMDQETILATYTPADAKRLGRYVRMIPEWDSVKLSVMEKLLREKFANPDLKARLLATGDAILVEGNTWGDKYWGMCNGVGENNLCKLLMKIRAE